VTHQTSAHTPRTTYRWRH